MTLGLGIALAGGAGVAAAEDTGAESPAGSTGSHTGESDSTESLGAQTRDDTEASDEPSTPGQDAGPHDEPPGGAADDGAESTTPGAAAVEESASAKPRKRSAHRVLRHATGEDAPQLRHGRPHEVTHSDESLPAEPTTDGTAPEVGAVITPTVAEQPDPTPIPAAPVAALAPEVIEGAWAHPESSDRHSETPEQSPASWVALAAARRELDVDRDSGLVLPAAAATVAPPAISAPGAVTGTVTGTLATTGSDGKKLSYKLVSSPAEGVLSFNTKMATFTYTPTAAQRVLAGLTSAPATVSFDVTVSNGSTTVPLTVTLSIAPVTAGRLGEVATGGGSQGVAVTNTRAYVVGTDAKTVTVIDTINRTVIGSILVPGASALAVKPDGTRLYVVNTAGGTLTVVDTNTLSVLGTPITVGAGPTAAAVSPDGKTLYVINSLDGTVSKVNTATNKISGTVKNVGSGAALITTSPDGKKIYVANPGSGVVSWFTSTSTAATPIAGLSGFQPRGLAVTPDGKTLYIGSQDGAVAAVDTTKNTVTATFTVDGAVAAMTLNKDGSLLLADDGSGGIAVISTATRSLLTTLTADPDFSAGGAGDGFVALSPDGMQLYVAYRDTEVLQVISLVPPNTQPTAGSTVDLPTPGGTVTGRVAANDADGDPLKFSASAPAKGTLVLKADGTFTYTPTAAARHAAAASSAPATALTDSFVVTIDDGRRGIVSIPVTVGIAPANIDPTAKASAGKPAAATGMVKGTVSATDKDKDALTYTATSSGAKGTVSIDAKGAFVYTPTAAARHAAAAATATASDKTDTVTVTVDDGHGGTFTLDVKVTISPRNTGPTTTGALVGQPDSTTGEVAGSVYAIDGDNDTLTYSASAATKKGSIAVRGDGTFSYTPTAAALAAARAAGAKRAAQTDKFTVTVSDGHGGTATIAVSVAIVNGVPVATAPTVGTANGATGLVNGKVTFTDPDRDKIVLGITGTPGYGKVVVKADGTFTYTPTATARLNAGVAGTAVTDSFTVTATDTYGAITTVDIVVPVDPARHIVTGSVKVGNSPAGVVVNRDGTRAYVTNYADGTLSVINTSTKAVIGSPIKLGVLPDSIAASPDGTRLYIVGFEAGTNVGKAVVVNTATNKVIGSPIVVGAHPTGIAVSPDGTRAYVTNGGDNTVSVVDTATRTVIGTPISVGKTPTGIAISPDGSRAYITNGADDTVSIIDTATGVVTGVPIAVGALPIGIAISSDGTRAYVASTNAGTVSVLDTATHTLIGSPIAVGANPQAIAVSPDGARVYVVGAGGTLTVVSTATHSIVDTPLSVGGRPHALAVGPDGSRIYATTSAGPLSVVTFSSTQNAPAAPLTPGAPTTNSNGTVAGTLGVTDATAITYAVTMRPSLGTVTVKADGSYLYTPTAAARQYASTAPVTDSFTVVATNARGASTSVTYTVNVAPPVTPAVNPTLLSKILSYQSTSEISKPEFVLVHPNGLRAYTINSVQTRYASYPPNTISVIDTVTNTVVGEPIYANDHITGAVLTPDGRHLYVLRGNTGTVWVIDTTLNNAVVAEVAVGSAPTSMVASQDGRRIYVLNNNAGGATATVSVIDTASKAVVGDPIALSPDSYSTKPLIISADSSRLVAQGLLGVAIIDTDSRTVTRNVALTTPFEQGALSPDGRTLYVMSGLTEILAIDTTTGSAATRIRHAGQGFRDSVLSPDGTHFYTTTTDSALAVFNASTGALIAKKELRGVPLDIAVSADGKRVYALAYTVSLNGNVALTTRLATFDTISNTFLGPALSVGSFSKALTVSPDGSRVYVAAAADGATFAVDTGRPATAAAETLDTSASALYSRLRRLTDHPWAKDGLAIEQVETNGITRVIVYFGGTVGQVPDTLSATRGALRNLARYFANEVDHVITARIDDALKDLPTGTEIMFVGYSQGGMDAQNIAAAWAKENHRGVVTTVITYAAPIVQPPGAGAEHVLHLRARHDPVPQLGAAGHTRSEADWWATGQVFEVVANVGLNVDLHGDVKTYADVGAQFDAVSATRYPTVAADLAKFAGTVINYRQY